MTALMAPATGWAACTLSTTGVAFGTYVPSSGTQVDVTGTVKLTADSAGCASQISIGLGVSSGYRPRNFGGGAPQLTYTLYSDAARTTVWGSGADSVLGNAYPYSSTTLMVYGRITASQPIAPAAYADTLVVSGTGNSTSLSVTASVVASCSISASSMPFGTYTGAVATGTATLSVICTNTTPYYLNLGNGLQQDGAFYPRMIGPGGALVGYKLYQDAVHSIEWRDTYHLDGQAGNGNGTLQTSTVYGLVAAGQLNVPGLYTDTIIARLTY